VRLKRVEKPWGWELWWALTERYVGKILHINRGAALSYQFHRKKDETIYVQRGRLEMELAPGGRRRRRRILGPGDSLRIRPGDHHRMTAITTCEILEASSPEVEDVVRLEDRYGRVPANGARRPAARPSKRRSR
jgi:mannose-6-phosphate isomerase-like protein (cupin superfamily)